MLQNNVFKHCFLSKIKYFFLNVFYLLCGILHCFIKKIRYTIYPSSRTNLECCNLVKQKHKIKKSLLVLHNKICFLTNVELN